MANITINYSDCYLTAEIVKFCLFGNEMDRCSVKLDHGCARVAHCVTAK